MHAILWELATLVTSGLILGICYGAHCTDSAALYLGVGMHRRRACLAATLVRSTCCTQILSKRPSLIVLIVLKSVSHDSCDAQGGSETRRLFSYDGMRSIYHGIKLCNCFCPRPILTSRIDQLGQTVMTCFLPCSSGGICGVPNNGPGVGLCASLCSQQQQHLASAHECLHPARRQQLSSDVRWPAGMHLMSC